MDEYAQLKRFDHDRLPQDYMHDLMYVYPETMPEEDHFSDTKTIVDNYKKMPTTGPVPKNWLGFSYIISKGYQLYQNFDETKLEKQLDHTSNDKVKLIYENIVVIE